MEKKNLKKMGIKYVSLRSKEDYEMIKWSYLDNNIWNNA